MMDVTMGVLPENNPPVNADPKALPGLWSLVQSYHGRMSIIDIGKANNVRVALDTALHKLNSEGGFNRNGEYLYVVKYLDDDEHQRLKSFEEKVKRKLNIQNTEH